MRDVGRVEAAAEQRDPHRPSRTPASAPGCRSSANARSNGANAASMLARSARPPRSRVRTSALPVSRSIAGGSATNSYGSLRQRKASRAQLARRRDQRDAGPVGTERRRVRHVQLHAAARLAARTCGTSAGTTIGRSRTPGGLRLGERRRPGVPVEERRARRSRTAASCPAPRRRSSPRTGTAPGRPAPCPASACSGDGITHGRPVSANVIGAPPAARRHHRQIAVERLRETRAAPRHPGRHQPRHLADRQPVAHRDRAQPDERRRSSPAPCRPRSRRRRAGSAGRARRPRRRARGGRAQRQRHRPDVGVVAAADVLQIDDQDVEPLQLRRRRRQRLERLAVQAGDRNARCACRARRRRRPCPAPRRARRARARTAAPAARPTAINRSTMWIRSLVTLAGWQSTPTRRPRSRSRRSAQRTSSPVATRTPRIHTPLNKPAAAFELRATSVDRDRLQRDVLALGVDLEADHAALPLLLQAALDQAQLGGERLDGDPLGRLALAAQRRDVLVEDARVVDRLALLAERVRVGASARRSGRSPPRPASGRNASARSRPAPLRARPRSAPRGRAGAPASRSARSTAPRSRGRRAGTGSRCCR